MTILVIDDESEHVGAALKIILPGYRIECASSGTEGLSKLRTLKDIGCVLLDIKMPPELGEENEKRVGLAVLRRIVSEHPGLPVLMHTTIEDDVELVQEARGIGAYWYVAKSSSLEVLRRHVREAFEQFEKSRKGDSMPKARRHVRVIGSSKAAQEAEKLISKFGPTDATVLLLGETGTGKDLAAEAIHEVSRRKTKPFQVVDCANLRYGTRMSELWGWVRGAFTDAKADRTGLIEAADAGTAFFDEIGELPLEDQSALLRVIREKEVRRLGENQYRSVDVRIVAATNRDLAKDVARGAFRRDLYERLRGFTIPLPPLRECREDVPALAEHFLARHTPDGIPAPSLSREAMDRLMDYSWPGNIGELSQQIERAAILADGAEIRPEHFDLQFQDSASLDTDLDAPDLRALLGELGLDAFCKQKGKETLTRVLEDAVREFGGLKEAGEALDLIRPDAPNDVEQTKEKEKEYNLFRSWCKRLGVKARQR